MNHAKHTLFWTFLAAAAMCSSAVGHAIASSAPSTHDRIVTADQQLLELQALKLLQTPVGREAKALAGRYLRNYAGVSGNDEVFAAALDKTAFCAALMAVNSDTNYPRIYGQAIPGHRINEVDVPESSCAIPNPDTIYRFIPVDGVSEYVITGQVARHRPIENNFTLASFNLSTIANINGNELQVADDGSFTITIGPTPANARPNHLQSRRDAFQIWIRDTLGDWSKEKPARLSVQRIGPAPEQPLSELGQAAMLSRYLAYVIFSMPADVINGPANTFKTPQILGGPAGAGGYLVTQAYSNGRFDLKDDEALLLKLKLGFAKYAAVPVTNIWGTNDGVDGRLTGALNNFQADRDVDGAYTFIISKRDPGLFNWIDTAGLDHGTLFLRWAGFPKGDLSNKEQPAVTASVVKFADLHGLLPNARRVGTKHRKQLQQQRADEYVSRQAGD